MSHFLHDFPRDPPPVMIIDPAPASRRKPNRPAYDPEPLRVIAGIADDPPQPDADRPRA